MTDSSPEALAVAAGLNVACDERGYHDIARALDLFARQAVERERARCAHWARFNPNIVNLIESGEPQP